MYVILGSISRYLTVYVIDPMQLKTQFSPTLGNDHCTLKPVGSKEVPLKGPWSLVTLWSFLFSGFLI